MKFRITMMVELDPHERMDGVIDDHVQEAAKFEAESFFECIGDRHEFGIGKYTVITERVTSE